MTSALTRVPNSTPRTHVRISGTQLAEKLNQTTLNEQNADDSVFLNPQDGSFRLVDGPARAAALRPPPESFRHHRTTARLAPIPPTGDQERRLRRRPHRLHQLRRIRLRRSRRVSKPLREPLVALQTELLQSLRCCSHSTEIGPGQSSGPFFVTGFSGQNQIGFRSAEFFSSRLLPRFS